MQIDFYVNFEKKKNSTKRPDTSAGSSTTVYTADGNLKEPCSIMNPVISMQNNPLASTNHQMYISSYVYIPLFSRYYFVEDWVWNDGLWELHLELDVLATWKTHLGECSMYVLRADTRNVSSSLNLWNGGITDTTYPATTDFYIDRTQMSSPFETSIASGVYVVGIIGSENTDAVGAITYYAMTSSQFGALKNTLFGIDGLVVMGLMQPDGSGGYEWTATDMTEQIFKTMYNPFQYIVSCNWFPVSPSSISGTVVSSLKVGWWVYSVGAKRITTLTGSFYDGVIEVPAHGQAGTRGRYLNFAPYTKRTLYGKFGSIPIDTTYFDLDENITFGYKYLVGKYTVDYVTGQCLYQLYTARYTDHTDLQLIHKTEFLLGVPIQLAQVGMDYLGTASTALNSITGTIGSTLTGSTVLGVAGGIAGAIGGVSSGIYDTIQSAMPQLETTGSNGSFINNSISSELISIFYNIVYEDIEHKGRTVCLPVTLKFLNGYVQCADGDIDIDCMDDERNKIASYLTSGFFWE